MTNPEVPTTPAASPAMGLELVTFLRLVWRNRTFLAITLLGAMLLAGAASFLVKKTYRGRAKIVVEVPKRRETSQIFGEPLTVLGYESLLNSDESFQRVLWTLKELHRILMDFQAKGFTIEKIREIPAREYWRHVKVEAREGDFIARLSDSDLRAILQYTEKDFRDLEFETFKESFSSTTTIEKETGVEVVYSPIIDMTAESDTPEKAALLANLWAQTFVSDIRGSLSVNAEQIVREIIDVASTTRKQLEEATEQLKKYEQEVGLGSLKQELEAKNLSLYGLTLQTQTETDPQDAKKKIEKESVKTSDTFAEALIPQRALVEKTIKTTEEQVTLLNAYLEPVESSGLWIGEQALSAEKPEAELEEQLSRAEAAWESLREETERAEEARPLARLRRSLEEKQSVLDAAHQQYRRIGVAAGGLPSATEEELAQRIEEWTAEKAVLEEEIKNRQTRLQQLAGTLNRVSILRTRLNYVRLTSEYQGAGSSSMTRSWLQEDLRLLDEQIQKASGELLQIEARLAQASSGTDAPQTESLRTQQRFYRDKLKELGEQKAALRQQAVEEMRQDLLAAGQVEQASASFEAMRKNYLQARQKRDQAMAELQQSHATLRGLSVQIRTLEEEIGALSRKISEAEAMRKGLEKKRDTYTAALENISEQVSEAVTEQGRRASDVRVQSLAVPPDRKVAPKRSLWVLTAGMLVLLFDLGFLLVRRLFELAPEPAN